MSTAHPYNTFTNRQYVYTAPEIKTLEENVKQIKTHLVDLYKKMTEMEAMVLRIDEKIIAMQYAPGGHFYKEAEKSFEHLQQNQKDLN